MKVKPQLHIKKTIYVSGGLVCFLLPLFFCSEDVRRQLPRNVHLLIRKSDYPLRLMQGTKHRHFSQQC